MKKGVKNLFIIIFSLLAVTSLLFLIVAQGKNQTYPSFAENLVDGGDDYSQRDADSNIILSAEKVLVDPTTDDDFETLSNDDPFRQNIVGANSIFVREKEKTLPDNTTTKKYYFNNIQNGSSSKYVIKNNEFVELNNIKDGDKYYERTEGSSSHGGLAEGVLLTFGGYIFKNGKAELNTAGYDVGNEAELNTAGYDVGNEADTYAGITQITIKKKLRNGVDMGELPGIRYDSTSTYQDFTLIIPQKTGWDGYYEFTFGYFVNNVEYEQSIAFYIIYNSSYNYQKKVGDHTYSSVPNLGNADLVSGSANMYQYQLGIKNEYTTLYPTLTYDYTKYKLSYTHQAAGVTTSYDMVYDNDAHTLTLNKTVAGNTQTIETRPMNVGNENIIRIVLTEMGSYNFNFNQMYFGYMDERQPDNLSAISNELTISGMQLNYSLPTTDNAQLKYLVFAVNNESEIGLFVPNGYRQGETLSEDDDAPGIMYTFQEDDSRQIGEVITENSLDANIRPWLTKENVGEESFTFDYDAFIDQILGNTKNSDVSQIEKVLKALKENNKYVKTNQGSLKLTNYGDYDATTSYYFYSGNVFDENNIFDKDNKNIKQSFNNKVTFNQIGYYLVFIDVDKDEGENYQIFAFQFTSDSIKINVETVEDTPRVVGAGRYTNKDVKVSWEKPGVFDRNISAMYYESINEYKTLEQLEQTTPMPIDATLINGRYEKTYDKVGNNNFGCFLIELSSEEKSLAERLFYIDKTPLTGVSTYRVTRSGNASGENFFYNLTANEYGDPQTVDTIFSSTNNDCLTLWWNNKASGASVSAKYYYIPFVVDDSDIKPLSGMDTNEHHITTKYKTGKPIGYMNFTRLFALDCSLSLTEDQTFSRQGIYFVELTDAAGQVTNLIFIIDNTEAYYYVQPTDITNTFNEGYYTNNYILSTTDVDVIVGTHKDIVLDLTDEEYKTTESATEKGDLANFKKFIDDENLETYYAGAESNLQTLRRLFVTSNDKHYIAVKLNSVETTDEIGSESSHKSTTINGKTTISLHGPSEADGNSFKMYQLYIVGENQKHIPYNKTNSKLTVEINTDEALGMLYYGNDQINGLGDIPLNGALDNGKVKRLILENTDMTHARATKDNYLTFVWNINEGESAVTKVTLKFYDFSIDAADTNFYIGYNPTGNSADNSTEIELYSNNDSVQTKEEQKRAMTNISVNGQLNNGLYIITRTLQNGKTLNYHFIVDKLGIFDADKLDDTQDIKVKLLGDVYTNIQNLQSGISKGDITDDTDGTTYSYTYFTTTKLPAEFYIPTSKFIKDDKHSTNYAGRLTFSLYYIDEQGYGTKNKTLELQTSDITTIQDNGEVYYKIDVLSALKQPPYSDLLKGYNNIGSNHPDWLFLPGRYVVIIKDKVETTANPNYFAFGFRIRAEYPTISISAYNKFEGVAGSAEYAFGTNGQYALTTNKRYIKIEIPKYNHSSVNAQLDPDYIKITKNSNDYYTNAYGDKSGENKDLELQTVQTGDGDISYYYEIDAGTGFDAITYQITARYKLSDDAENEKYENIYYKNENGQWAPYYEVTATIVIDRESPTENINYLIWQDKLVNEFDPNLFSTATRELGVEKYYLYQYNKYYNNNRNKQYLYAFQVNTDTPFNSSDVSNLYIKKFNPDNNNNKLNWELPILTSSGYTDKSQEENKSNYGALLGSEAGYYEIVEADKAGNLTQYLVLFTNKASGENIDVDNLQVTIPITGNEENNNLKIDLSKDTPDEDIPDNVTMFGFGEISTSILETTDKFYIITISRGEQTHTIKTNFAYDFNKLAQEIVGFISAGAGNYTIVARSRTNTNTITVNYYTEEYSLDASKLVEQSNGVYYINLNGANISPNGVEYYAKQVIVSYTSPTGEQVVNTYKYDANTKTWKLGDNIVDSIITCLADTTYELTLTDVCNKETYHMFNTSGKQYYSITFGEDGTAQAINDGTKYIAFQQANIYFDDIFNKIVITKNETTNYTCSKTENGWTIDGNPRNIAIAQNSLTISFERDVNGKDVTSINEYSVTFYIGDNEKYTYNIVLDNRTSEVTLRASITDQQPGNGMAVDDNVADLTSTVAPGTSSGSMYLTWDNWADWEISANYFYTFTLYQWLSIANNEYTFSDISEYTGNVYNIETPENSDGLYRLVITVVDNNGNVLGNRVYTFTVKARLTDLYTVRNGNLPIEKPSAYFAKNELSAAYSEISTNDLPENDIPLYISTDELSVDPSTDLGASIDKTETSSDGKFTLYKITANKINLYVGVLKVDKTSNLVSNLKITAENASNGESKQTIINVDPQESLSYSVVQPSNTTVTLTFDPTSTETNKILNKNTLELTMLYNDELVSTFDINNSNGLIVNGKTYSFNILGNGRYTFIFRDKAGNTHTFNSTYTSSEQLEINVIREVLVNVNGKAPVNNAFYNEPVVLTVLQDQRYSKPVTVSAKLNGQAYTPAKVLNDYTFNAWGTYRVTLKSEINCEIDGEPTSVVIEKRLVFTIINPREARQAIDLSALGSYDITSVNQVDTESGEVINNVSGKFAELLNKNEAMGMLLTYQKLIDGLNVNGKVSYQINYTVTDNRYPTREESFVVTLNNEIPTIECTLAPGESTTKSFTITFNPGIIYMQVGDCSVFVNEEKVADINNASLGVVTYTVSESQHGPGDYYISLRSSSGNVILAYKVVVKEPLNVWSIVIIVVVVAVVVTVVTIIIVLRTRMKIR